MPAKMIKNRKRTNKERQRLLSRVFALLALLTCYLYSGVCFIGRKFVLFGFTSQKVSKIAGKYDGDTASFSSVNIWRTSKTFRIIKATSFKNLEGLIFMELISF